MRVAVVFLALLLSPLGAAGDDRLHGTWQSDRVESMKFVSAHTIREPREREFLEGTLGELQRTFDSESYRYDMPSMSITIAGKPFDLVAIDESYRYHILGSDYDSVALLVEHYRDRDRMLHIHFASADVLWVYSEESDYGLRDLNVREYFRRLK